MTNKISNILFDFGGVFYDIDLNRTLQAFKLLNVPESLWRDKKNNIFLRLEKAEISAFEFMSILQLETGDHVSFSELEDAFNAILIGMPVENVRFLRRFLKSYNCYLLSNTNEIHYRYFSNQIKSDPQTRIFYQSFIKEYYSHVIGLRKPDPQIFNFVLEDSGILPHQTIFVDDFIENIETARSLGFQVFHFGIEGRWEELIQKFNLEI